MKIQTGSILSILALTLSVNPAYAGKAPVKKTLTGHIDPSQVYSFVYVPFEVEPETISIYVLQSYSEKGSGNSLDLGIFDQRGYQLVGALIEDTSRMRLLSMEGPLTDWCQRALNLSEWRCGTVRMMECLL